jgi:hypothetical protein
MPGHAKKTIPASTKMLNTLSNAWRLCGLLATPGVGCAKFGVSGLGVQSGSRRVENVAFAFGIGHATLILLVSHIGFGDDFPAHGKLLPFPAMIIVCIKAPD